MLKVIEPKDIRIHHIDKVVEIAASYVNHVDEKDVADYRFFGRLATFTIIRGDAIFTLKDKTDPIKINLRNMRCIISYYETEKDIERDRTERRSH